ncbi:MAG: putative toxin-antitoxin system toxin component, PIN family [Firmicutes bacterium]|nr:putative toxin-antitoxin system toxin component, PIN family [Bacillota bacterium]
MQYPVVIDTNILVSALLSKHSDAATVQVVDALYDKKIIPVYNEEILQEYENVLHRKKFNFSEYVIQTVIHSIRDNGICAERLASNETLPDPKDLVFYEVCMAKRDEECMLVTGNMKHFPAKPFIVTPNELLEIIKDKM